MTKFRDLKEGYSFDFVGPERMLNLNSFYLRCKKVSTRNYIDERGYLHHVGSINCNVYNVDESGMT
jgi:hypothetical protein